MHGCVHRGDVCVWWACICLCAWGQGACVCRAGVGGGIGPWNRSCSQAPSSPHTHTHIPSSTQDIPWPVWQLHSACPGRPESRPIVHPTFVAPLTAAPCSSAWCTGKRLSSALCAFSSPGKTSVGKVNKMSEFLAWTSKACITDHKIMASTALKKQKDCND